MFALATAIAALAATVSALPQGVSVSSGGPSSGPVDISSGSPSGSVSVQSGSPSGSVTVPGGSSISSLSGCSFNNWGGLSSLSSFDNFYGSDNYCGNNNQQTVIEQSVQCHSEEIVVLQQQYAILTEFAKRILTEQICEVETQTIVWNQFVSSLSSFSDDFQHHSGRSIGYDHSIAAHISGLVDSSNNIITTNYGFQGLDIGSNTVVPTGSNWQSGVSQISVQQAQLSCNSAIVSSHSSSLFGSSFSSTSSSGFGQSAGTFAVGGF